MRMSGLLKMGSRYCHAFCGVRRLGGKSSRYALRDKVGGLKSRERSSIDIHAWTERRRRRIDERANITV